MKTTAVRMYGANDLRLESFELPGLGADEVLMKVVSDSLCTSTYNAVKQGSVHKRVPPDIAENPVIIGHEMCGEIVTVEKPSGAKKVCCTHPDLPLIAVDELEELGKDNALYAQLGRIVKENGGLWCAEAEAWLLASGPRI